jgi:hypothetical protein
MDAVARALSLPEMLAVIFEHLAPAALFAAAVRVCHVWAAVGLRQLWCDVPTEALGDARPSFGGGNYDALVRRLAIVDYSAAVRRLRHKASCPWKLAQLQHLARSPRFVDERVHAALQLLTRFAPTLRSVAIACPPHDFPFYDFLDAAAGVLPAVARRHHLRALEVVFAEAHELDFGDVLALRFLRRLKTLRLYGGGGGALDAWAFADGDCARLAAGLPRLREWDVDSELGLTPAGYLALGRHCRQLTLHAPSDLRALPPATAGGAAMFPELRLLSLENIVYAELLDNECGAP